VPPEVPDEIDEPREDEIARQDDDIPPPLPADTSRVSPPRTIWDLDKACRDYVYQDLVDVAVGGDDLVLARLRWFPGAKRPSIGLRWGLGLYFVGMSRQMQVNNIRDLHNTTLGVGSGLANRLQEGIDAGDFGDWPRADDARLNRVMSLGIGTATDLKDRAPRKAVDAYIMLTMTRELAPVTRRPTYKWKVRVFDTRGEVDVWSSKSLSSTQIAAVREGINPAEKWIGEIIANIDEQYRLQPMPPISAEAAKSRAESLAGASTPLLERVIELRYYHAKKLITDTDLAAALDTILGRGKGAEFVTGDEATRRKLLAEAKES
jgi:hypothetical protein